VFISLKGIASYSRSLEFVDLVKQSRAFGSVKAPWDGSAKVDDIGLCLIDAKVRSP